MRRTTFAALTPIAVALLIAGCVALLIAGCGSSKKSSSSTVSSGTTHAALITTKHDKKLGTILAFGPKRLTVYLFEGDKGQGSSCTGGCVSVWPPVTGKPQASGTAVSSDLGTIKRADGTTQVTYKGHPLYLYVKDKDDGDAYGEAIKSFGAEWYALKSSGQKVDLS